MDFTAKSFDEGVESAKKMLAYLLGEQTVPKEKAPIISQPNGSQEEIEPELEAETQGPTVSSDDSTTGQIATSGPFKDARDNAIKASELLNQGRLFYERKEWSAAANVLREILALIPNHVETWNLLAEAEAHASE